MYLLHNYPFLSLWHRAFPTLYGFIFLRNIHKYYCFMSELGREVLSALKLLTFPSSLITLLIKLLTQDNL